MDYAGIVIGLIFGAILGGIIGWMARRPSTHEDDIKRAQLNALLEQHRSEILGLRKKNEELVAAAAASTREVEALNNVRKNMMNDFRAVSAELIEQQKQSVIGTQKTVLTPMQEEVKQLKEDFDRKLSDMLKNATENKTSIDEQIKNMMSKSDSLAREATNLANALKNKKTQGCWGETYLENVLQMLGLVEGVDYAREVFFRGEDGKNIRPDFIVNLPGGRRIIIDSKVSMESYLNYENAETDEEREQYANEFIRATEAHIATLSNKEYQKKVHDSGLDYVFMFMPIESAYILAMRKKPELYTSAQSNNVALITSSLLFPMLKTIEMLLKMDKQNKNIAEVVGMVDDLYDKYVNFTKSFASVGQSLASAQTSYDKALGQLSTGRDNLSSRFNKIRSKSGITNQKNIAIDFKDE